MVTRQKKLQKHHLTWIPAVYKLWLPRLPLLFKTRKLLLGPQNPVLVLQSQIPYGLLLKIKANDNSLSLIDIHVGPPEDCLQLDKGSLFCFLFFFLSIFMAVRKQKSHNRETRMLAGK